MYYIYNSKITEKRHYHTLNMQVQLLEAFLHSFLNVRQVIQWFAFCNLLKLMESSHHFGSLVSMATLEAVIL